MTACRTTAQRDCGAPHCVPVESALDDQHPGPAQQHARHCVGITLTDLQNLQRTHHPRLLKTIVISARVHGTYFWWRLSKTIVIKLATQAGLRLFAHCQVTGR